MEQIQKSRIQGKILALKSHGLRLLSGKLNKGQDTTLASMIVKLYGTEMRYELESLAIDVMGELGMTEGFDVGFEMSGVPSAFCDMLNCMNHGGKVALLGIPPQEMTIPWPEVIFKGLVIKGIYGREMFETWYKMASLLQSGLDLAPIVTHRFAIDEFQQGFDTVASGVSGKVILEWD